MENDEIGPCGICGYQYGNPYWELTPDHRSVRNFRCYPCSKRQIKNDEWTITLNKYQRDNLLWNGHIPGTNTGDWCGEIPHLLSKLNGIPELDSTDMPNSTLESWIKTYGQK